MNLQLILDAISRIEQELAIVKSELASQALLKPPKKLTKKQIFHNEVLKTLATQKQKDRLRAEKMFKKELEDLADREKELEKLIAKNKKN